MDTFNKTLNYQDGYGDGFSGTYKRGGIETKEYYRGLKDGYQTFISIQSIRKAEMEKLKWDLKRRKEGLDDELSYRYKKY